MDEIKFKSKLTEQDLFNFYLYNAYTSSQGVISIVFGIIGIAAGIFTIGKLEGIYPIAYIILGILFFVYLPFALKFRAKNSIKNEILSSEMEYTVTNKGVHIKVNEEEADMTWDLVYKVVTKKDLLLVYSNMKSAYIIPRQFITGKEDDIIKVFRENLPEHRLKIKW